jgi:hypothetical protein
MKHKIAGVFYQANLDQVKALMAGWLGAARDRARLFGHTWELKTDQLQFHLETSDRRLATYYMDAYLSGTEEESIRWTEGLVKALQAADILYLVDRVPLDDQEEPLEEAEVTYAHPELDARYIPQQD